MIRFTWLIVLLLITTTSTYGIVELKDAAGIWLFDEGSGDIAHDSSGNNHDGQISKAKWTDGMFGNALLFEGNGEVTIQSTEKLSLGSQLTMMAYIYTHGQTGSHQLIIAKSYEYLLRIDTPTEGGRMSAFVQLSSIWEPRASSPNVPDKNTWIHLAGVYDSQTQLLRLFIDGAPVAQSTRTGKPNPMGKPITLGSWGGVAFFSGKIDDVAIFNSALKEEEIKEIATVGLKAYLLEPKSVRPIGKLTTTWGDVKGQ